MFVSALTSLSQRKLFADARPDMFVSALTSLSQRKLFADAIACPDTICQVQVQSAVPQRVPEVCSEGASQVSGVVVVPEVGSEGASQVSGPEGASQVSGPDVPEVGSSIGQSLPELTSDSGPDLGQSVGPASRPSPSPGVQSVCYWELRRWYYRNSGLANPQHHLYHRIRTSQKAGPLLAIQEDMACLCGHACLGCPSHESHSSRRHGPPCTHGSGHISLSHLCWWPIMFKACSRACKLADG